MVELEIKGGDAEKEKKSDKKKSTLSAEVEAFGTNGEVEAGSNKEINLAPSDLTQKNTISTFEVGLNKEVAAFSTADQIALGDLEIRKQFAAQIIKLFVFSNLFVMVALGVCFWSDYTQIASRLISEDHRIIDNKVIMALLGATTVQLGAVIYTMTQAIFPTQGGKKQ